MNITNVKAFGTYAPTEDLALMQIQRRALLPNDVLIDIKYCGVCHSDLHTARNDWGSAKYPSVPGHEIIGMVIEVGAGVTKFKIGDIVGVGCLVDSCRTCTSCQQHLEQYCLNGSVGTYNGNDKILGGHTFGGYSERIVVDENYVLRIPANLDLEKVAPLLCAGITVYSPLKHWQAGPGKKVAVIGLGGLGHMAIKIAKGLGAEVSLFSRSTNKTKDALNLGADKVIISTNENEMQLAKGQFELIIDTVPYDHDINPYISTLAVSGTLVLVGYLGDLGNAINTKPMISGRKAIGASVIGGIKETQEMLDFCGEKDIVADVEVIQMQDINEAYERMLRSDVHYRFVIDMQSLKES